MSATQKLATASREAEPLDRRRLVFGIVSIGLFMASVDQTIVATARSAHPGLVQARVFLVFAALLVLMLPLVRLVPDHHGTW